MSAEPAARQPVPVKTEPGDLLALSTDAGWILCEVLETIKTGRASLVVDSLGRQRKVGPRDETRVAPAKRTPVPARAAWRECPAGVATWEEIRDWIGSHSSVVRGQAVSEPLTPTGDDASGG